MIEVYNYLDGKNICNIFASLIVNEINKSFPDAKTEITVINLKSFFVVQGTTSSNVVLDLSDILSEFYKKHNKELVNSARVFDLILYEVETEKKLINISQKNKKKTNTKKYEKFLNDSLKSNLMFNIKVDEENKIIYFDCLDEFLTEINYLIINEFKDYKVIKDDFSKEVFISDSFYGLSNNKTKKLYQILLKNIEYCLFKTGISSESNMSFVFNSSVDEDCISLKLNDGKYITNKEWLTSLILDVFPFKVQELEKRFDLTNYSSHDNLLDPKNPCPWENLKGVGDLVLL